MKLTGKCKEAFLVWLFENHEIGLEGFELGKSVVQNALIIEFFDSVKIFINIKSKFGQRKQRERFSYSVVGYNSGFMFDSRQEVMDSSILSVNGFYNKNK